VETAESRYEGFALVEAEDGTIRALPVPRDLQLYAHDRTASIRAGEIIDQMIASPEIGSAFLDHMAKENKMENIFTTDFNLGEALYTGPAGQTVVVRGIRLVFTVVRQRTSVSLEHGAILDAPIAFGEGTRTYLKFALRAS